MLVENLMLMLDNQAPRPATIETQLIVRDTWHNRYGAIHEARQTCRQRQCGVAWILDIVSKSTAYSPSCYYRSTLNTVEIPCSTPVMNIPAPLLCTKERKARTQGII